MEQRFTNKIGLWNINNEERSNGINVTKKLLDLIINIFLFMAEELQESWISEKHALFFKVDKWSLEEGSFMNSSVWENKKRWSGRFAGK